MAKTDSELGLLAEVTAPFDGQPEDDFEAEWEAGVFDLGGVSADV